jgi:hypothetical protein
MLMVKNVFQNGIAPQIPQCIDRNPTGALGIDLFDLLGTLDGCLVSAFRSVYRSGAGPVDGFSDIVSVVSGLSFYYGEN